jgi:hypothetical protein
MAGNVREASGASNASEESGYCWASVLVEAIGSA